MNAAGARDFVLLYVNGSRHEVRGSDVFLVLSDFLRCRLRLTGTKVVCAEGDCGSCTVLVGRPCEGQLRYEAIDSCIAFMFQLDLAHIVTVEGLAKGDSITPVQTAMIKCHGSQCGFCTPGFVVAMTALLEERDSLDEDQLRAGLSGNLCRCTGYTPILQAGGHSPHAAHQRMSLRFPAAEMLADFAQIAATEVSIVDRTHSRELCAPCTVQRTTELKRQHPAARLVAGATDFGVQINKGAAWPRTILDLSHVRDLKGVRIAEDSLDVGAVTTWTELKAVCEHRVPELCHIICRFGSPQIRNMGTLGGNIANASPIADALPFLYVADAELELRSDAGARCVNINEFYLGYKKVVLQPEEVIARIRIPLPDPSEMLRLIKVSRRQDLDISTVTAAIRLRIDTDRITAAAVALGGVGPQVLRARRTEAFLIDRQVTPQTMRAAGDIAVTEIAPISDVRGTAEYRRQLVRNVFPKVYYETIAVNGGIGSVTQ